MIIWFGFFLNISYSIEDFYLIKKHLLGQVFIGRSFCHATVFNERGEWEVFLMECIPLHWDLSQRNLCCVLIDLILAASVGPPGHGPCEAVNRVDF
jgi:hypothetical protein